MSRPQRLTPVQVRRILEVNRVRKSTPTLAQLAREFGVSTGCVHQIIKGTIYKRLA